jgi:hypothetical protein
MQRNSAVHSYLGAVWDSQGLLSAQCLTMAVIIIISWFTAGPASCTPFCFSSVVVLLECPTAMQLWRHSSLADLAHVHT